MTQPASTASALDDFDRHILALVQHNNQLTHAEIGDRVGLSPSAVRRRLKHLRQTGYIIRDVAILRQEGIGVRLIVLIAFETESHEAYAALDALIAGTPEILQAYHVAGATDYVLILQAPDLKWFESWGLANLMSKPGIRRYDTQIVWSCRKFETALPFCG